MLIVRNRLRELIAEKSRRDGIRITLSMVAEATGLSKSTIANWHKLKGEITRFDSENISLLCQYFDCEIADLLVLESVEEDEESPEMESLLIPA